MIEKVLKLWFWCFNFKKKKRKKNGFHNFFAMWGSKLVSKIPKFVFGKGGFAPLGPPARHCPCIPLGPWQPLDPGHSGSLLPKHFSQFPCRQLMIILTSQVHKVILMSKYIRCGKVHPCDHLMVSTSINGAQFERVALSLILDWHSGSVNLYRRYFSDLRHSSGREVVSRSNWL